MTIVAKTIAKFKTPKDFNVSLLSLFFILVYSITK